MKLQNLQTHLMKLQNLPPKGAELKPEMTIFSEEILWLTSKRPGEVALPLT